MPVKCDVETILTGQERFHAVDKAVMRHVFDIHNTLGRFCDERIYQDELAERCRADGFDVQREVLLSASFQDFAKPYYLDMLVERGVIYELKAVETLNSGHQKQLINYLLLAGRFVGTQQMCMLNADTAWHLSAVREHHQSYETHLGRLLGHMPLDRIHWINFDQRVVMFKSLIK